MSEKQRIRHMVMLANEGEDETAICIHEFPAMQINRPVNVLGGLWGMRSSCQCGAGRGEGMDEMPG